MEPPLLVDSFRRLHPTREGAFTCWCNQTGARATNYGRRIDYILCSPQLCDGALATLAEAEVQQDVMGSDHCPVTATLLFSSTGPASPFLAPREQQQQQQQDLPPLCAATFPEFRGKQASLKGFLLPKAAAAASVEQQQPVTAASSSSSIGGRGGDGAAAAAGKKRRSTQPQGHQKPKKQQQLALSRFLVSGSSTTSSTMAAMAGGSSHSSHSGTTVVAARSGVEVEVVCIEDDDEDGSEYEQEPQQQQQQQQQQQEEEEEQRKQGVPTPAIPEEAAAASAAASAAAQAAQAAQAATARESFLAAFRPQSPPRCHGHDRPMVLRQVKKAGPTYGKYFWSCTLPEGRKGDINSRCDAFVWDNRVRGFKNGGGGGGSAGGVKGT